VLIFDQAAKILAGDALGRGEIIVLVPGVLSFELSRNTGVAFGAMAGAGFAPAALALMAAAVVAWASGGAARSVWGANALALMLGGAAGNLLDRVRSGFVVDFIALPWWPTFNLADAAIVCGAAALAWRSWRTGAQPRRTPVIQWAEPKANFRGKR
jgi:signal peptidase II